MYNIYGNVKLKFDSIMFVLRTNLYLSGLTVFAIDKIIVSKIRWNSKDFVLLDNGLRL